VLIYHCFSDKTYVKFWRHFQSIFTVRLSIDEDPISIQDLIVVWRNVWILALPERRRLCLSVVVSILAVIATMIQPVIIGRAVDNVSNSLGNASSKQLSRYFAIIFILVSY